MNERPIIFNTEMVKAILDGKKSTTRRVIKPQYDDYTGDSLGQPFIYPVSKNPEVIHGDKPISSPYGVAGDHLYVRETWGIRKDKYHRICFRAGDMADNVWPVEKWRPSIHLPKRYSRIWLKVKGVRVERVQDITTEEIKAEGVQIPVYDGKIVVPLADENFPFSMIAGSDNEDDFWRAFWIQLWESINKKRGFGWEENPWCWCVSFEVISKTGKPKREDV